MTEYDIKTDALINPPQWLQPSFLRICAALEVSAPQEQLTALYSKLVDRWNTPLRKIHNIRHLATVLEALDVVAETMHHANCARLATWYYGLTAAKSYAHTQLTAAVELAQLGVKPADIDIILLLLHVLESCPALRHCSYIPQDTGAKYQLTEAALNADTGQITRLRPDIPLLGKTPVNFEQCGNELGTGAHGSTGGSGIYDQSLNMRPEDIDYIKQVLNNTAFLDDARALLDAHLSVLATDPQRYRNYQERLRQDFAKISPLTFLRARISLVDRLLSERQIFRSPLGQVWEAPARENLFAEKECLLDLLEKLQAENAAASAAATQAGAASNSLAPAADAITTAQTTEAAANTATSDIPAGTSNSAGAVAAAPTAALSVDIATDTAASANTSATGDLAAVPSRVSLSRRREALDQLSSTEQRARAVNNLTSDFNLGNLLDADPESAISGEHDSAKLDDFAGSSDFSGFNNGNLGTSQTTAAATESENLAPEIATLKTAGDLDDKEIITDQTLDTGEMLLSHPLASSDLEAGQNGDFAVDGSQGAPIPQRHSLLPNSLSVDDDFDDEDEEDMHTSTLETCSFEPVPAPVETSEEEAKRLAREAISQKMRDRIGNDNDNSHRRENRDAFASLPSALDGEENLDPAQNDSSDDGLGLRSLEVDPSSPS